MSEFPNSPRQPHKLIEFNSKIEAEAYAATILEFIDSGLITIRRLNALYAGEAPLTDIECRCSGMLKIMNYLKDGDLTAQYN